MFRSPLNLALSRTLLVMLEEKTPEVMAWDLGYHHAKRGRPFDPTGAPDPEAYKRGYEGAGGPQHPKEHYSRHLFARLPEIAKGMMATHVDRADPRNRAFLDNPDSPAEHAPKWHQWGVITHTKMFGLAHDKDVQRYLQNWGVKDRVDRHLDQEIDGQPKRDLLRAGIALHDLGKFTHRTFEEKPDGSYSTDFADHEAKSGELIRGPEFADSLKRDYDLTDNQVEYIAKAAELHFQLGILRSKAKQLGNYNMAFARSPQFPELAREQMRAHPDMALEMGLLFLGDSMAKTNIRFDADSDEEIQAKQGEMMDAVQRKLSALPPSHQFNPKLIQAAQQLPVNVEVAKQYLKTWAADQQSAQSQAPTTEDWQLRRGTLRLLWTN